MVLCVCAFPVVVFGSKTSPKFSSLKPQSVLLLTWSSLVLLSFFLPGLEEECWWRELVGSRPPS